MPYDIKNVKCRSHHDRMYWVEGDVKDVIKKVAEILDEYVCPMYEHMRSKILEVDTTKLPSKIGFRIYKNLYAGD